MEPRGFNRWQSVANREASDTAETSENRCRALQPRCRSERMVKRGSTVRVRQKASTNRLQSGRFVCLGCKRLSRAGTRGHELMFAR